MGERPLKPRWLCKALRKTSGAMDFQPETFFATPLLPLSYIPRYTRGAFSLTGPTIQHIGLIAHRWKNASFRHAEHIERHAASGEECQRCTTA